MSIKEQIHEWLESVIKDLGYKEAKVLVKTKYNEENFATYSIDNNLIIIYVVDENGLVYPEDVIIRVLSHELAHHVQFHYNMKFETSWDIPSEVLEEIHNKEFAELQLEILNKYYNNEVPEHTLDFIKKEWKLYGIDFKEKKSRRVSRKKLK